MSWKVKVTYNVNGATVSDFFETVEDVSVQLDGNGAGIVKMGAQFKDHAVLYSQCYRIEYINEG